MRKIHQRPVIRFPKYSATRGIHSSKRFARYFRKKFRAAGRKEILEGPRRRRPMIQQNHVAYCPLKRDIQTDFSAEKSVYPEELF
jgi:hypothetical protein